MGSFSGHVLPGSFFVLYGMIWIVLSILTHLKSKPNSTQGKKVNRAKRDQSTMNSASFFEYKRDLGLSRKSWLPLTCPAVSRVPLEPILKIVLSFAGILVEAFLEVIRDRSGKAHIAGSVYHIYRNDGSLNGLSKLQHITMYGAFMLSGIVDILTMLVRFPHQTSALFLALAFSSEGILFYFHTGGREAIDVEIHFILTLVIGLCALFAFLRVKYATTFLVNTGLGFSIVLQGVWFIQAAYFLYPPSGKGIIVNELNKPHDESGGDHERHALVMFIACTLVWHVLLIMIGILITWVVLMCLTRSSASRRCSKRRGALRLSPPRKWQDFAENEKLINIEPAGDSVGDGVDNSMEPVAVEMQQLSDMETATL